MENEVVLPPTETVPADTTEVTQVAEVVPELNEDGTPKEAPKPEKTAAEKELIRIQRGIDRKTRQNAELKAKIDLYERQLTDRQIGVNSQGESGDTEKLSLTRSEILELAKAEAQRLAPTLADAAQREKQINGVLSKLEVDIGKPQFVELLSEVNEVTGGLLDGRGNQTPIAEAIFGADNPRKVLEFLADPDNEAAAARLSGLSAFQLGKEFAKLEAKLSEKPTPQVSKASAPIEAVRGSGKPSSTPQDSDSTEEWMRKENARMKAAGIRRYG